MSKTIVECEVCNFQPCPELRTYVCTKCGYLLTKEDKQKALRESNAMRERKQ